MNIKAIKSALFPVYFIVSVLVSLIGLWMFFGYLIVALSDAMVKGVDGALGLVRPKGVAKKAEMKKEVKVQEKPQKRWVWVKGHQSKNRYGKMEVQSYRRRIGVRKNTEEITEIPRMKLA